MSEYEKLTVVKLRDELVKRGLPKTGLKAALVQRLQEADGQPGGAAPALDRLATEAPDESTPDGGPGPQETTTASASLDDGLESVDAATSNGAPQAPGSQTDVGEESRTGGEDEVVPGEIDLIPAEDEPTLHREQPSAQPSADLPMQTAFPETPNESSQTQVNSQSDILSGVSTQPAPQPGPAFQLPTPMQTQSERDAMILSISTEDSLEDSRKRKRRSQSPPPSTMETQKRLKADNANPHVELPEDAEMEGHVSDHHTPGIGTSDTTLISDIKLQVNGHRATQDGSVIPRRDSTPKAVEAPSMKQEAMAQSQPKTGESPIKPSPSDTRFKSLFTAPPKVDHSSQQPPYPDTEERVISPALHPATSALYIRELMRPLKSESIKDHIAALATPADTSVDPSVITEFFLDSIRTHCLVGFASISAASRVRSGLHDRIWPNERDRKPLFVDFVPEEKLKKWIDVEQNAPSGRGQPQKRWEVVYEDEDGAIKAYLQEVGTNGGGLRAAQPVKADAGQGVKGAPSGPKVRESDPRIAQAEPDNGKGFQALDDLFNSTDAKPKLYYQPVSKATADRRLDKLSAGRGGGRSDEMRRYTFEDDVLVDRAPEFGNRGRGGRGGFSGGYRGRGGGYRGDGYHGTGDGWRDRRFGY